MYVGTVRAVLHDRGKSERDRERKRQIERGRKRGGEREIVVSERERQKCREKAKKNEKREILWKRAVKAHIILW